MGKPSFTDKKATLFVVTPVADGRSRSAFVPFRHVSNRRRALTLTGGVNVDADRELPAKE